MPRPGPRPYECVRRAWHSDRHQPIRGSLIQEIFRVVSEIHSSDTKRNKEWQQKLPIVVLKAEEIMYSKANSEVEYMDVTTLWDRANDAIRTIIRQDDSTETEGLLQPCIEASLQLGCIPRRASRSQRDNDPRRYLSPNPQESLSSCLSNLRKSSTSPHCMSMCSEVLNNAALSPREVTEDKIPFKNLPLYFLPQTSSSGLTAPETRTGSVQVHSVYPLYYWDGDPQLRCNLNMNKTIEKDMNSQKKPEDVGFGKMPQTEPPHRCDLSLRLGPSCGSENTDNQSHHQEFQNTKSKNSISTELQMHVCPYKGDAKYLHLDNPGQKRKALSLSLTHSTDDMICLFQPKLSRDCENPQIIKYPVMQ